MVDHRESMRTTLPYGSWPSPVTTDLIVEGAAALIDTWAEGETVWWSEMRPSEGGRIQIVRRDPDATQSDLLPEGFSARNRVHEYGGAAWFVAAGVVYFTNWDDQRIYRLEQGRDPIPITPEPPTHNAWRYADGRVTPDGAWIICVREDHTGPGEAKNEIVGLPVDGSQEPAVLVSGRDFVAAPRVSPDGRQLAWITWDHPNMPWDDTELWIAMIESGGGSISVDGGYRAAGGPGESVMEPYWGPDGTLYVISDRTNWWNVYRVDGGDALHPMIVVEAEIGGPAWQFGQSSYGCTAPDGAVVAAWTEAGSVRFARADADGDSVTVTELPYLSFSPVRTEGRRLIAVARSADREGEVVRVSLDGEAPAIEVLRESRRLGLDLADISRAQPISFPSADGRIAYAHFYPPANSRFAAPACELPPLLVLSHGGPTAAASTAFQLNIQYWTSRGFALVDVDYGGSTGYGRQYRKALEGTWGIVDVEDCCAAAEYLVAEGLVDGDRLAIRGGSAGGFTTLAALAFKDTFQAGANHFGVSDMGALATETHKFESRYLDSLVGPYPESKSIYDERSPINHVDGFAVPLITFQGLEDAVVLPNQSERICQALDAKGVPHAYLAFAGEQHGFRRADTIKAVHDAELSFYGQVFGFEPHGVAQPVQLNHADKLEKPSKRYRVRRTK